MIWELNIWKFALCTYKFHRIFVLDTPEEESVRDDNIPGISQKMVTSNSVVISPSYSQNAVPVAHWVSPTGVSTATDTLVRSFFNISLEMF